MALRNVTQRMKDAKSIRYCLMIGKIKFKWFFFSAKFSCVCVVWFVSGFCNDIILIGCLVRHWLFFLNYFPLSLSLRLFFILRLSLSFLFSHVQESSQIFIQIQRDKSVHMSEKAGEERRVREETIKRKCRHR